MSEENNRLTLGEVTRDDLTIQPDVPQDDLTRYFEETPLPNIMEDFRKNGTEPDAAYRILAKRGYSQDQVDEEMAAYYEEQRQFSIHEQQKADEKRREEETRIEALSAQSERATPLSPELDKQVETFELATTDEDTGEITSAAIPQYAKIMQESGALDDPLTPIALPKDIDNAMMRGEDVGLRYQSYQNDKDIYDLYAQHELAGGLYEAFQDKDVAKYNAIARELTEMGMYAPEVESLDEDLSDVQMNIFGNVEDRKKELIEERNRINAQFGLPSSFNPDSDVDFRQVMRESLIRQKSDFDSSDYAGYLREVENLSKEMLDRSNDLDSFILGDDHGAAIEGVLQGLTKKFVVPLIEGATVGLPNMYYDGIEALGIGSPNDVRRGRAKIKAKMQASRKLQDAMAMERQMRLMQRGLSEMEATAGVSELFQSTISGETSFGAFANRLSYEVAEGFGQAIGYMVPIGRAATLRSGAQAVAGATAKAAAGKAVPRGVGLLTAEQAVAAKAIDAASDAAKALSRANARYHATFAALGVNSASNFYKDLYDRKDLTFAEKMLQSSIVGVAEATLGKVFSKVDAAFVSGARKTAQAATLSELKQMSKEQLKNLTRGAGLKKAAKVAGRGLSEEFAEEFGVELVGQSVSIVNDLIMGRQPQEVNWHQLVDAGLAGMFGAGPTSVMSGVGTYMAHHSMLKERKDLVEAIGNLDAEIANATTQEEVKRLKTQRDVYSLMLMKIDGDSKKAFSKMSQGARRQLLKIHRDLAYTANKLKDPNLTKEEREQLQNRYEVLLGAKQRLEKQEDTFESSVDDSEVTFTDAEGQETTVTTENATTEDKQRAETAEKTGEFAPENQKQEEEELSTSEEDLVEKPAEEAPEEAPAEEAPEEGFDAEEIDISQALDVTDPEQVGEEGRMTVEQAIQTNALIRSYGKRLGDKGVKILRHRSQESLKRAGQVQDQEGDIGGFFDAETNTIHLAPDATAREIQEEFAHAVFRDILGEYAEGRENLFNYLNELAETNKGVAAAIAKARTDYADRPESEQQEEAIVEVLLGYAEGSIDLNRQQRNRVIDLINAIYSYVAGTEVSEDQIQNDAEFKRFAESFKRATRGEVDVEVAAPAITKTEAKKGLTLDQATKEAERTGKNVEVDVNQMPLFEDKKNSKRYRKVKTTSEKNVSLYVEDGEKLYVDEDGILRPSESDKNKLTGIAISDSLMAPVKDTGKRASRREAGKEYTYLKDATVFFEEDSFAVAGESPVDERYRSRKIDVKNYNDFRRWYNRVTANGTRANRVKDMTFYGADGKMYKIRPPRPYPASDPRSKEASAEGKDAAVRRMSRRGGPTLEQIVKETKAKTVSGNRIGQGRASTGSEKTGTLRVNPGSNDGSLEISINALRQKNQKAYIKNAKYFANLDIVRAVKNFPDEVFDGADALSNSDEVYEIFVNEVTDNLLFLYDSFNEELRDVSTLWYDGANIIAQQLAAENNMTLEQVSSVIASLSPQKGWYENLRLAEIVIDFIKNVAPNLVISKDLVDFHKDGGKSWAKDLDQYIGKPFSDITNGKDAAAILWAYSVLNVDTRYRITSPNGTKGEFSKNKDGAFSRVTWSSRSIISNAIRSVSASTLEDFSNILGNEHKIRNFFNNISNPGFGLDATIDTHAVAASHLKPLASASGEVLLNLGGTKAFLSKDGRVLTLKQVKRLAGTKDAKKANAFAEKNGIKVLNVSKSQPFGFSGAYYAYLDAYRKAAEQRGVLPREMQSVTWEAVRLLYTSEFKRLQVNQDSIESLHKKYTDGELTKQELRNALLERADGIGDPDWADVFRSTEGDGRGVEDAGRVPGEGGGRRGPGARGRDSGVVREQVLPVQPRGKRRIAAQELDDRTVDHRVEEENQKRASKRQSRRGASFTMSEETGFQKWKNKWIRRLQDKYVDIFNIQRTIESQRGKLESSQDFQMAEELMYGKAAEDLAKLDKKIEEITAMMKEAGVSVEELSDYLYALHAKERNAVIENRTEGEVKNGSGMTNAEADAIINAANKAAMDPIVSKVREIQADTRKTMVKYGLETQETIDAFERQFQNYVPLSGVATDELTGTPYPTGGAGMNVFGPTTKRAKGRGTRADNVLAQIVAQNAGIHIKARTNEALNSLYNLVESNPNPNVWRVLNANQVQNSESPNVVAVRVNGKQKFIYFKDPSYAETLRGMNLPQTNMFIRVLRKPAQWLRRAFTTLNPEFVISNFSRDIQSAIFNAASEAEIEGGMLNSEASVRRVMKLVPQTLRTLVKNSVQKGGDPAIEKYFEEFKEDGGKTGWAYQKPLDQILSELEGATEEKTRTQEIFGKAKNFTDTIEGINDAFENSIRLASYIAAREAGIPREKAAQVAKNITVNFNKQGEWGPTLNAVYLFFNASVQGTARLGRSLLSLRPQKRPDGTKRSGIQRVNSAQWMAAGLGVFGSMLTMLGYAMSDEDEDGTLFWDKIPDYVKERNLIIMRPNGKDYFKIPMPYGFNFFANLGTSLTESAYGNREADEAFMFLFNSFMGSFSPVSFGQSEDLFTSVGKGAVPTVMKPFVDVMVNETYFGSPVTGENLPFGVQRPDSELSFRSPEEVKDFFRWLNEATGGSEYKEGGVDINPDKFWYMFEYYIGGAGQFLNRSLFKFPQQLGAKLLSDEDIKIEAGDVPMLRILYGQPSKYYDMEKFKENEKEFRALYREAKEAPRRDDLERYKGISTRMNSVLNKVNKQMSLLRKAEREARKIEDYSQRMARIQELKDKQRSLIMQWNKYYEQARN